MQHTFSALFGHNSQVEIYGGEFRNVEGNYTERVDVEEVIIEDSSNVSNVTINERRFRHSKNRGHRKSRDKPLDTDDGSTSEEERHDEDVELERPRTTKVGADFPLYTPPPIGLSPKAQNYYQLVLLSASSDLHKHQEQLSSKVSHDIDNPKRSKATAFRELAIYSIANLNHDHPTSGPSIAPKRQNSRASQKASSKKSNGSSSSYASSSGSRSKAATAKHQGNAFSTNVQLQAGIGVGSPEVYNGDMNEVIHEATTTNINSGTVFNASVKSRTRTASVVHP